MQCQFNEQNQAYNAKMTLSEQKTINKAKKILASKLKKGHKLCSPNDVRDYITLKLGMLEHEVFCVLFLNNQNQVLQFDEVFSGTVNETPVYPREIVKRALYHNAASVILVHNHPSGETEPSSADMNVTSRLQKALKLIDIEVLDHMIVAGSKITSFAERGIL